MKVSIIITAYNVEKYIKEAIDSCINQTYKDLEIVIVEDCSTDSTKQIIEQYNDPRIKIIQHEKNLGCGLAKRSGIKAVTGEYFILLDADDWLDPNFIEIAIKNATDTDADIVMGNTIKYNSNGDVDIQQDIENNEILIGIYKLVKNNTLETANNKLIRTSLRNKITWSDRRYFEDTQTLIQILFHANKISCINKPCFHYRYNEKGIICNAGEIKTAIYKSLCLADVINFILAHQEIIMIVDVFIRYFLELVTYIDHIRINEPQRLSPYKNELDELKLLTYRLNNILNLKI
jgi:glycosyltransferase involved in cell wall biosynthesis